MNKHHQRTRLLKERQALNPTEWITKSKALCLHLRQSQVFQQAQTILIYFSHRQEPDLTYLWQDDHPPKTWGVPRCVGQSLVWHPWDPHRPEDVQRGAYGILEPLASLPILDPDSVDLILVPAVACDRSGVRLGYGGGFYDRLLSQSPWSTKPTVGIVFEFALLEHLEPDPWDCPVQRVCTEAGLWITDR